LDGVEVPTSKVSVSAGAAFNWKSGADVEVVTIASDKKLPAEYYAILRSGKKTLAIVDPSFEDMFKRIQARNNSGVIAEKASTAPPVVFVLGTAAPKAFDISAEVKEEKLSLSNVAGMIPGKSKPNEYVIFSGHYDHLGIIKPMDGDSIANGADDDATGTTAVISLAKYYKKLNNNERTLIFVAFTAEEIGGYGSKYFSQQMNADQVVAMFNIEMIGKDSKFGPKTAFITGFERSDFGAILQKNLEGTEFKFHPDPYIKENLFYRSDNATLAALGVPAHSISTDQIDSDKLYHSVNDEFESLDVNNIIATIRAIALSSRSIVSGKDTPTRIPKVVL
jgi:Zn-dependent M28 family amino/carboxypeptidase